MSLCPESEYRASLTDAEFWEHVFHGDDGPDDYDPDDDPYAPTGELGESVLASACDVCGTLLEACAYDVDGRPMIHVVKEEDDV